jgi:hypothetical protein
MSELPDVGFDASIKSLAEINCPKRGASGALQRQNHPQPRLGEARRSSR